jgi:hypothetical protein
MVFHATHYPRDLSVMATYTQTSELPIKQAQAVTGPLPSYVFGPCDDMFTALGDLRYNKYVTSRALIEVDAFKPESPPALVMALTQELNHGRLEQSVRDAGHVKQLEDIVHALVKSKCNLCPSLRNKFERLGFNRLQSYNLTKDNKCWLCGKERHIKQIVLNLRRCSIVTPPTLADNLKPSSVTVSLCFTCADAVLAALRRSGEYCLPQCST